MKHADMSATIAERFWRKVTTGFDGCWYWTGAVNSQGYGKIKVRSYVLGLAHRVSYVLAHGEVPDGLHVCHTCDHPLCVRPDHLFVGSDVDNMHDAALKNRMHPWNSAKTHCKRGHPLTGTNLRIAPSGAAKGGTMRQCRECGRIRGRRNDARRRHLKAQ